MAVDLLTKEQDQLITSLIKENASYPTKWGWDGLGQLIYLRTYARDMFRKTYSKKWLYEYELPTEDRLVIDTLIEKGVYKHKKENWAETIGRVIRGAIRIGTIYSNDEIKRFFQYMLDLKMSVSGRALWQLDTKLPNEGVMDSLLNCWYHSMDQTNNFAKIFEKLMLGGGVGFSVQKEYINHLPSIIHGELHLDNSLSYIDTLINILNIKGKNEQAYELEEVYKAKSRDNIVKGYTKDKIRLKELKTMLSEETYLSASEIEEKGYLDESDNDLSIDRIIYVGDSREGWVSLLTAVLETFYAKGGVLTFNTSLVRPYGELIKGFGGKASGDFSLIKGMFEIANIFSNAIGRKLTSVEVMDVVCIIADIVVSGNVRRSALLALGDDEDIDFITSKRWDLKTVPNYRSMANLSVATNDTNNLPQEFWDSYRNKDGECIGLFNLRNAQNYGRMGKNKEKDLINYFNDRGAKYFSDKNVDEVTLILENGERVYKADPMVKGTNPCVIQQSVVLTREGVKTIGEIQKGDEIWSKEGYTTVLDKWSNGVKQVYKYKTNSNVFYGTEDHKIFNNGELIKIGESESIDCIVGDDSFEIKFDPQTILDGLVIGDGTFLKDSFSYTSPKLNIGKKDLDYYDSEIKDFIYDNENRVPSARNVKTTLTMDDMNYTFEREIPARFMSFEKIPSFLRGLFSANGSVIKGRVKIRQSSKKMIEQIQIMLNAIGLFSYITTNRSRDNQFRNGIYTMRENYDLNVSNTELFEQKIGFIQKYKQEALSLLNSKKKSKSYKRRSCPIVEIENLGEQEVFDIAVDNQSHSYWTAGCDVSNCFDPTQYVLAKEGLKHIKDIQIGDEIWGKDSWTKVINKWSNGIKEIWSYKTSFGKFLGTADHKIFEYGKKVKIGEAFSIDSYIQNSDQILKSESCSIIPSPIIEKFYIRRGEVFDITVDNDTNSLWSDNLHVSNCAEMNGDSGENCNLSVININRVESYEELLDVAKLLYKLQKAITQGDYIFKDDQAKINQNSRIGLGITGVLYNYEQNKEWGSRLYEDIREFDKQYSLEKGYPQSIKLTVQKPDGTLGLLMGTKAGIHLDNSPYWHRTVRFASNDPLVKILQEKGYRIEDKLNFDGTSDPLMKVVYFACKSDTPNMTELNTSAVDQIRFNMEWQEAFVDQSVSQTVKFQQDEVESIINKLNEVYKNNIKAISFLRHSNFSFAQMPYSMISEEEYNDYMSKVEPLGNIDLGKDDEYGLDDMSEGACEGGVCPIK